MQDQQPKTPTPSLLQTNTQQSDSLQITNAQVINYIRKKCNLSAQQIQHRLLEAQFFPQMPEEGVDLDTKLMEQILKQNDFYQKPQQKLIRQQTMKFVKRVVDQWSMEIAKTQMRISQDQISNYMSKLLPFGSYVLDLKSNTSDIDLICVVPNFIKRQTHFFEGLYHLFQKDEEVKHLSKIVNAKVPIINFEYKETDIDISFCQLNQETVPRDIEKVITNDLVASISDQRSKTSILGRKNNLMILQLTGKQIQNFKQTLRVVKIWSKNRQISSNGMGYLGGISWAILVAKICQIFPNHKPMKLLQQFFMIYSMWNWRSMPLTIMPCSLDKTTRNIMCVVTPGSIYNSTERVNEITFKVLQDEFKRANQLMLLKRPLSQICKKNDFINSYPLFIQIDICGRNGSKQDEKQYKEFQGNVESKVLRLLLMIIDSNKRQIEDQTLKIVPFPTLFKKKDPVYQYCKALFLGIRLKPDAQIDLGIPITKWSHLIYQARGERADCLNLRIFQGRKQDFGDVQIDAPKKKKEQKMDPRLAMRLGKIGA